MKINEWVNLLEKAYTGQKITCPECNGKIMARLFAKSVNGEKTGFAVLECEKCKAKQQFSRVKFPDHAVTEEY